MEKIGRTIRRRRREGKTDYKARFGMLKSGIPRVVVRRTNKYIISQIIISDVAQDRVVASFNSKDLMKNGWPEKLKGSLKSLPAAYLTGYGLGKNSKDYKEGILDIGLQRNISKSRLYAFVKGLIDSGFKIPMNEEVLPGEEFLNKKEETGKLIKQIMEEMK